MWGLIQKSLVCLWYPNFWSQGFPNVPRRSFRYIIGLVCLGWKWVFYMIHSRKHCPFPMYAIWKSSPARIWLGQSVLQDLHINSCLSSGEISKKHFERWKCYQAMWLGYGYARVFPFSGLWVQSVREKYGRTILGCASKLDEKPTKTKSTVSKRLHLENAFDKIIPHNLTSLSPISWKESNCFLFELRCF